MLPKSEVRKINILVDVGCVLAKAMQQKRVSAKALGASTGHHAIFVRNVLCGTQDIGLTTLTTWLHAMGYRFHLTLSPVTTDEWEAARRLEAVEKELCAAPRKKAKKQTVL